MLGKAAISADIQVTNIQEKKTNFCRFDRQPCF